MKNSFLKNYPSKTKKTTPISNSHAKKMKGGLNKRDKDKTFKQAVMAMIENDKTEVSIISYDSLKGFIFKIKIPGALDKDIEFYRLYKNRRYRVTCLILKFAILTSSNVNNSLPKINIGGEEIYKETMTESELTNEATLQQFIYSKTLEPNGKYICPAIAFCGILPANTIDILLSKSPESSKETIILKYVKENTNGYTLGAIAMELAQGENEEDELKPLSKCGHGSIYNECYITFIAELLVLFVKCKVINCDANINNGLLNQTGTEGLLIDFGSGVLFDDNHSINGIKDSVSNLDVAKIKRIYNERPATSVTGVQSGQTQTIFSSVFTTMQRTLSTALEPNIVDNYILDLTKIINLVETDLWYDDAVTYANISNIIKFMSTFDYAYNVSLFPDQITLPQMNHVITYLYDENWTKEYKYGEYDANGNPGFMDTHINYKYSRIIKKFRELIQTNIDVAGRNITSERAITGMRDSDSLYSSPLDRPVDGSSKKTRIKGGVGKKSKRKNSTKRNKYSK